MYMLILSALKVSTESRDQSDKLTLSDRKV